MLDLKEPIIKIENLDINLKEGKFYAGIYFLPISLKNEEEPLVKKTISEAVEDGTLKIEELESSTVPYVKIENTGPDPILGYRGNIIRGGGQNRQIVHSFVIGSNETLNVPVQCIQQGRWNPHSNKHFTSLGEFTSSTLRYSNRDQGDVWTTVTQTLIATATVSPTSDYTATLDIVKETTGRKKRMRNDARIEDKKKVKNIKKRAQQIWEDFKTSLDRQVGLFTIMIDPLEWLNNKKKIYKKTLEIFETNQVYKKVHEELITSFITDVASLPNDEENLNIPLVKEKDVLNFIESVNKENWKKGESIGREERIELENSDKINFGESIFFKDKLLHLIYATNKN